MQTWRNRDIENETWKHGDKETMRQGYLETWRYGDMATWRHVDMDMAKNGSPGNFP